MTAIKTKSTITCPQCRESVTETMPEEACQYFWECPNCTKIIKAEKGDCCVFCSYGTVDCPPVQRSQTCC